MILKQRMFRMKPYTKCIDCIRTDHIRCKNCMQNLVNQIMKQKDHGKPKSLNYRNPKYKHLFDQKFPVKIDYSKSLKNQLLNSTTNSFRHEPKQKYEIQSKYDLWMKHITLKKDDNNINYRMTLGQWPIKKRVYLSTDDIHKNQKKFQQWQKKFYERIRITEQNKYNISHNHQLQRISKTAIKKQRLN